MTKSPLLVSKATRKESGAVSVRMVSASDCGAEHASALAVAKATITAARLGTPRALPCRDLVSSRGPSGTKE
jgi:hypothetical protein